MSEIVIYTVPTCSTCNSLKAFLEVNNVDFKEVNLHVTQGGHHELKDLTGQKNVPAMVIEGDYITGFERKEVVSFLEDHGVTP